MISKLIPSERRESVLSYCLIFLPKLHKIDLEITVSKRDVFKTRLSRNHFSRPNERRGGFVKTLFVQCCRITAGHLGRFLDWGVDKGNIEIKNKQKTSSLSSQGAAGMLLVG